MGSMQEECLHGIVKSFNNRSNTERSLNMVQFVILQEKYQFFLISLQLPVNDLYYAIFYIDKDLMY